MEKEIKIPENWNDVSVGMWEKIAGINRDNPNHFKIGIDTIVAVTDLTEEWLERFGFQKEERGNVMRIKVGSGVMLDDDVYELCWHKGDTWLEIFQDYHTHSMSLPDTLFVHEMQNLFKPLTGNELNLNEL